MVEKIEIKYILLTLVIVLSIYSCSPDTPYNSKNSGDNQLEEMVEGWIYVLDLAYNEDKTISLMGKNVERGYPDESRPEETYKYDIISSSGKLIYSAKFLDPSSLEIMHVPPEGYVKNGTPIPKSSPPEKYPKEFSLLIPYYKNAKSINIYNDFNMLVLSVNVSDLKIK